jgi:xylose isomerase
MIERETLSKPLAARYAGWDGPLGRQILAGELSLDDLARKVSDDGIDPRPQSGAQEQLEGAVNRRIWRAGAGH